MKKVFIILLLSIFVFPSCRTSYVADKTNSKYNKIDKKLDANTDVDVNAIIAPYKDKLDAKMNEVLGYSDGIKMQRPESPLGNWVADAISAGAARISGEKIDFAIQNYGGVRIKEISKGDITLGKIYELMPFDNFVVVLKANGEITKKLFNKMALYGGWPISSSVRYKIKNDRAIDIIINGEPFDTDKTYTIALPDYIANGGDKCYFLSEAKKIDVDQTLIRDVLIQEVISATKNKKYISAKVEGRVVK